MLKFEIRQTLVEVRTSFFLTLAFMLTLCEGRTVIVSLFSSVLHETGHILAFFLVGEKIDRLLFSASGMRIDRKNASSLSFCEEIFVAVSGVAVNLTVCAFSYAFYRLHAYETAGLICAVNMVIALFNILPVESLDGARALMFFLCLRMQEERAQRIMNGISAAVTVMLIVFFSFTVYIKKVNPSFAVVIIYLVIILINRIFRLKKSKI